VSESTMWVVYYGLGKLLIMASVWILTPQACEHVKAHW